MPESEEKKLLRRYAISKERLTGLSMVNVQPDFEKRLDQAIEYEQAQEDCATAYASLSKFRRTRSIKTLEGEDERNKIQGLG